MQLLPGRFAQLRLAFHLSLKGGLMTGLFGRGLGSTRLGSGYKTADDVPVVQRTGSTWLGVVVTEAGWLGISAFGALLLWLLLLGRNLWFEAPSGSADKALEGALPGIVALTALGAGYVTILVVRGYSIPFWLLVGVAISAARERNIAFGNVVQLSRAPRDLSWLDEGLNDLDFSGVSDPRPPCCFGSCSPTDSSVNLSGVDCGC